MAHALRRALLGVVLLIALAPVTTAGAQTTSGCAPGQAAAGATQYPVGRGQLGENKNSANQGDSVTVSGCGFKSGSSVSIDLLSTPVHLATVTADANGGINATVTIPKTTPSGQHTLEATGVDPAGKPLVLSASITIGGSGALAKTGTSATAPLTAAGVGLVLIGGVAVMAARRRRAARAEA
jgi:LPXTG-motif cell wall-anchored protein